MKLDLGAETGIRKCVLERPSGAEFKPSSRIPTVFYVDLASRLGASVTYHVMTGLRSVQSFNEANRWTLRSTLASL